MPTVLPLYDTDFHAWCETQAFLLHDRQWQALDRDHLIEELQLMASSERRALGRQLERLLGSFGEALRHEATADLQQGEAQQTQRPLGGVRPVVVAQVHRPARCRQGVG